MAVVRRGGAARAWRRCRRAQRMRSPARPRRTAAARTGGGGWARRSGGSCGARCGCGGGQADACRGRELRRLGSRVCLSGTKLSISCRRADVVVVVVIHVCEIYFDVH